MEFIAVTSKMKILSTRGQIFYLILMIIYVNNITGSDSSKTSSGIMELINYIKVHSGKYQVCLLMGNDTSKISNKILLEIEGNFPTRSINFNRINDSKVLSTFRGNIRRTTLFIVMTPSQFSSRLIQNLSTFFNQLSTRRMRPKCLFILEKILKPSATREILLKMWNLAKIFDLTIYQLKLSSKSFKTNHFISHFQVKGTLKIYNPFTKTLIEENISQFSEFFPDKLQNLHQHQIKVGFFDEYRERNLEKIEQVNAYIMKDFAKVMNFRVQVELLNKDKYNELKNERNVYDFMEKEKIDMIPDFLLYGNPIDYKYFQASRPLECIKIFAFIRITTRREIILLLKQFLYMMIIFAILTIILSKMSTFFKLNYNFWNPMSLIQIILGVSLDSQPKKLVDRIIFGSLILTYAVYSAKIFEALVNIGEVIDLELPVKSLEELNALNYYSMMTNYTRNIILDSQNEHVQNVLNLTNLVKENGDCYKKLVSLKNISCIVAVNGSRMNTILSVRFFDKFKKPTIKALDFCLVEKWMFWSYKSGFPLKEKFDRLLLKLVDYGFYNKYMEFRLKTDYETKIHNEKHSIKQEVFFYSVFTIGSCSSIFVFICELLINKYTTI